MKVLKNKTLAATAMLLLLAVSTFALCIHSTNAAVKPPITFDVFAYVSAVPNPIGVGETALITFRIDQPLAGATVRAGHATGITLTITKPDNTAETKGPYELDSTSSGWITYVPTQVGTYKFQMHFPKQGPYWVNSTVSRTETLYTYNAAESTVVSLTVLANPVSGYDRSPPLPTEYWARPINAENKGWWQVADDWLMLGYDKITRPFAGATAVTPYTSAPQSPHILYTKSIVSGGLAGGSFGDASYYSGASYEQYFDPMILQGTVFFSEHGGTSGSPVFGTRFFNLYTGQDYPLMYATNTSFYYAQKININTPNEHGVLSYLVVSRTVGSETYWDYYEILPNMQQSPRLRFTLANVSGLTNTAAVAFGPNGEFLSWTMGGNATMKWIAMFNSTRACANGPVSDFWSPTGTVNAKATPPAAEQAKSHSPYWAIEWNVTIPIIEGINNIIGTSFAAAGTGLVNYNEGYLLTGIVDSSRFPLVYSDVAYDIGQILKNRSPDGTYPTSINHLFAANRTMIHDIHNRVANHILDGKYVRFDEGEEVFYCFDIRTGALLWQTEPVGDAWAVFTREYDLAYGRLISSSFDGHVWCYDLQTGKLLWDFYKGSAGFENAYGTYPSYAGFVIADGVVYTTSDEHSPDAVLWRGSSLWALNITTNNPAGELLWKINGYYRHPVVADGILTVLNSYDGQVYAFGKGTSKTTISAPTTAIALNTGIIITGSVTDQTPSSKDTPAISDEDMSAWMEYMYMQKTKPTNAKGVDVTLTAVDPNHNTLEIGTVTSDIYGNYGLSWTPPVPGQYQIIANYAGSNSYGSSASSTYIVVGAAAVTPAPSTPTPTPAITATPTSTPTASPSPAPTPPGNGTSAEIYIAIAAIVVIIVVAAVAVLLKRK